MRSKIFRVLLSVLGFVFIVGFARADYLKYQANGRFLKVDRKGRIKFLEKGTKQKSTDFVMLEVKAPKGTSLRHAWFMISYGGNYLAYDEKGFFLVKAKDKKRDKNKDRMLWRSNLTDEGLMFLSNKKFHYITLKRAKSVTKKRSGKRKVRE